MDFLDKAGHAKFLLSYSGRRKVGNKCIVAASLFGRLAVELSCGASRQSQTRNGRRLQAFEQQAGCSGQRHAMLVWRSSSIVIKPQPCSSADQNKASKISTRMAGVITLKHRVDWRCSCGLPRSFGACSMTRFAAIV